MTARAYIPPLFVELIAFEYECPECGHRGCVNEQTKSKAFDPATGRFTCPNCWETGLVQLLLTPAPRDADSTSVQRRTR